MISNVYQRNEMHSIYGIYLVEASGFSSNLVENSVSGGSVENVTF